MIPVFESTKLVKKTGITVVVVDPPTYGSKSPLPSGALKFLANNLKQTGLSGKNTVVVAAAPYLSADEQKKEKVLSQHLKDHKEEFDSLIDSYKPKMIITFGKSSARQVTGRAVKIMECRGLPFDSERFHCPVLPTLNLFQVNRVHELRRVFEADMRAIKNIVNAGYKISTENIANTNYRWCTDLSFLLKKKPKELAVDVETTGGAWFNQDFRILTIQLTWAEGEAVILPMDFAYKNGKKAPPLIVKRLKRQLAKLLEDPKVKCFGHNFKYDVIALETQYGIKCTYDDDTILLVHAIDENLRNKNLDDSVKVFVPDMAGYNDAYNRDPIHQKKTRMDLMPPEKMLPYGCGDTDASFRLRKKLLPELKKDKAAYNCYRNVVMPAVRAFCNIEQVGFTVDEAELRKFEEMLKEHQDKERDKIFRAIPESIKAKYRNTGVGLKLSRDDLLRDYLFLHPDGLRLKPLVFTKSSTEDNKKPSVSSKTHLPYFFEHDIVRDIAAFKKNDKLLNTYVKKFYKYIYDGKVRPTYQLFGTDTGRTSSKEPNGQNFPKRGPLAKQYRKIFKAPPGWVLIEADLSQIELRIAAVLSKDKAMIDAYLKDGDLHTRTAAGVMGIPLEKFMKLPKDVRALKRYQAKAVNFGFIYGMWWPKFKIYAKTEYGIDYTDQEARRLREMFFTTYPRLTDWHRAVSDFVKAKGYVRSLSGRVRHLPSARSSDEKTVKDAVRKAINAPVQEFGNTIGLLSLDRIDREIPKNKAKAGGFIHDAAVCLARKEHAAWACREIKKIMETNDLQKLFGIKLPIPIKAEVSVGTNLAEMHELSDSLLGNKKVTSFDDIIQAIQAEDAASAAKLVRKSPRRIKLL